MNKYYKKHDGTYYTKYTKEEIKNLIDIYNPDTFIPFLIILDYPYIIDEWRKCAAYYNNSVAFSHYIGKMQLASFRNFYFKDSEYLNIAYDMMRSEGGSKS